MESAKLDISGGKPVHDVTLSTYKQIPENDCEDEVLLKSKTSKKSSSGGGHEKDGADEKMLPDSEMKVSEKSNIDVGDVKFVSSDKQNGDAKVDIGDVKSTAFMALGKEELMKCANDPFWIRLRWFLFIAFWLTWAAMLVGAILIIVAAPKCSPPEPRTWWEEGPLAEVESDTSEIELQRLKDTGVQGVIVTLSDDAYKPIKEEGSLITFLKKVKSIGINPIIDLKPGVSDVWFEKSENENDKQYSDYYIWAPPKYSDSGSLIAPNNWISKKNESSWKFSQKRKRYYYSPENSPQLNFSNFKIIDEFSNVLVNFIKAGVMGVRLTGAPNLLVDPEFKDESPSSSKGFIHTDYGFFIHTYTEYLNSLGPLLKQWQDVVKNKTDNKGVFMVKENLKSLNSFKVDNSLIIDLPVRNRVFSYNKQLNATEIKLQLDKAFAFLENDWPLWQQNTNVFPEEVLNIVTFLLPGTLLIDKNATLSKTLLELRKSPSIMFGNTTIFLEANNTALAFTRLTPGNPGYLVLFNPSDDRVTVNLKGNKLNIPDDVTVQLVSKNYNETNIEVKKKASSENLPVSPKSVIVLSYVP